MCQYSVIICKATNKPVVFKSKISWSEAYSQADTFYSHTKILEQLKLAETGISIQIIYAKDEEKVEKIGTGNLKFHGIEVQYQFGSI